jgi:bifunctional ADP-heptose synthase (sugar kinase/adenylyltransferase)
LAALGVGAIRPIALIGDDGEGYELRRALLARPGVRLDYFEQTDQRRTFTYCKPLVIEPGKTPRELNRLDSKNWTPTPALLQGRIVESTTRAAGEANGMILMDQVDIPQTGVVTSKLLEALPHLARELPGLLILADSRRGLRGFDEVALKMNSAELASLTGSAAGFDLPVLKQTALELSRRQRHNVFVTLAEYGMIGATPEGEVEHVPALSVRGEIDIVGAGDSVTANLTAALAAGATVREALEIANAAASVVIHQLGTTGTAPVARIGELLFSG